MKLNREEGAFVEEGGGGGCRGSRSDPLLPDFRPEICISEAVKCMHLTVWNGISILGTALLSLFHMKIKRYPYISKLRWFPLKTTPSLR